MIYNKRTKELFNDVQDAVLRTNKDKDYITKQIDKGDYIEFDKDQLADLMVRGIVKPQIEYRVNHK